MILETDGLYRQRQEHDREMQGAAARGQQSIASHHLYLILRVRREYIKDDTLSQMLFKEPWEFRKELKVVFDEEDGIDVPQVSTRLIDSPPSCNIDSSS